MITAQDIREKTFEKSTFGGYAMNEVDDFLDELAGDLAAAELGEYSLTPSDLIRYLPAAFRRVCPPG